MVESTLRLVQGDAGRRRGVRENQGRAMEISDKVREDLKRVAYESVSEGILHDVRVRYTHDAFGDECIKVTMIMDDGLTDDELSGMDGINMRFMDVLDDNLQHLLVFWELRTPEQMAQLEELHRMGLTLPGITLP